MQSLSQVDFVSFDVETTGLDFCRDRIVELAAVRFTSNGVIKNRLEYLVQPQRAIPVSAIRIHGITNDMVRHAICETQAVSRFLSFLDGERTVLIAHNATFDFGFLDFALRRVGLPQIPNTLIDTITFARHRWPGLPSYSLDYLSYRAGLIIRTNHRALPDALLTMETFLAVLRTPPPILALEDLFALAPPVYAGCSPIP